MAKDKVFFFNLFAVLAVLADGITIYQFIASEKIFEVWTFGWVMSVIFSFAFLFIATALFQAAATKDVVDLFMGASSVALQILSMAMFLSASYRHIYYGIGFGDFSGYVVIVLISWLFSLAYAAFVDSKGFFRFLSYPSFFALAFVIILLVDKYSFNNRAFVLWPFVGEIFLLLSGLGMPTTFLLLGSEKSGGGGAP
jgi:hypothetical protein